MVQEQKQLTIKDLFDLTGKTAIIPGGIRDQLWLRKTVGLCSKRIV